MWKMGKWNSKTLKAWLKDFSPDFIFFASGDYAFSYRIAYSVSLQLQIPIVLWCFDDFTSASDMRIRSAGDIIITI